VKRGAFHAIGGNELALFVHNDDRHRHFLLARVRYRVVDNDARFLADLSPGVPSRSIAL
jgi:hypothetical protein